MATALRSSAPGLTASSLPWAASRPSRPAAARPVHARFGVRPYTLREGDSLESIVAKRDLSMAEVRKLNHNLDPSRLKPGSTLILPLGKLSARDRQILDGMKVGNYRTYPVRKGEKLDDILAKRNIKMEEFKALNPDVNPRRVKADQVIKLPARKFSTREREMLTGAGAPNSFFYEGQGSWVAPTAAGAAVVAAAVFVGILRARADDDRKSKERDARRSEDIGDPPPPSPPTAAQA